ncbi:hypothetical protein [Saccharopolyspora erythraea]|uniref:hypothetical protein n=1 Tax=Saccharopolyspora erythraea TaxID=1836 RepID=UPI0020128EA8|nr:hypothetical protein [Saccharopolyspora erythraea]
MESLREMANTAHFVNSAGRLFPQIVVRDDRGRTVAEFEVPPSVTHPAEAEAELRAAGWKRDGEWGTTANGWEAPVSPL